MTAPESLVERLAGVVGREFAIFGRRRASVSLAPHGPVWTHIARALLPVVEQEIAAARAEALREAADALNIDGVGFRPGWGSGNEGDQGALDALGKSIQWLRDRAARIARTATSTEGNA